MLPARLHEKPRRVCERTFISINLRKTHKLLGWPGVRALLKLYMGTRVIQACGTHGVRHGHAHSFRHSNIVDLHGFCTCETMRISSQLTNLHIERGNIRIHACTSATAEWQRPNDSCEKYKVTANSKCTKESEVNRLILKESMRNLQSDDSSLT